MRPEPVTFTATLGLGGNVGDPVHAMAEALRLLDGRPDCRVLAVSAVYRTPPWGKTDQADFFNAGALIQTILPPVDLLDACLGIERDMKRVRVERWGPRTIDIDVLTYEDRVESHARLELPHPRMTERGFVLKPLADVAPDLVVAGKPIRDWLQSADLTGIENAELEQDWWRNR